MEEKRIGYGKRAVVNAEGTHVGGAIHEIEKGKRTDMLFHIDITKVVYVMSGKLKVWVLRDGQVSSLMVEPGASFFVRPGLPHQLEAEETAIVVEFVSDTDVFKDGKRTMIIGRGSQPEKIPEPVEEGEFALMHPEDEEKLAASKPTPKKTTRKKRTTKRTTKKKTRRGK